MRILEPHECLPEGVRSIVTVGNFDGVHSGHRFLVEEVARRAAECHCASVLITFEPHPRLVLKPDQPFEQLTSFGEKMRLFGELPVDYVLCLPFTPEFSRMEPEAFVEKVLVGQLRTIGWVMGQGHGIGKDRAGENNVLQNILGKYHIVSFTANLLEQRTTIVSSTQIRLNIVNGRIDEAVGMLGHPYLISTRRIAGLKIGSQLGFPTLNFVRPPSQKVLPPPGVYAAEMEFKGLLQHGALYFGDCPTFSERPVHFEFHVLDTRGAFPDLGEDALIWIHRFIRHDRIFPAAAELVVQIEKDITTIRNFFNEERGHASNQGT
jgi:riboflavin kinase/FMN adenylyltransferase